MSVLCDQVLSDKYVCIRVYVLAAVLFLNTCATMLHKAHSDVLY